MNKQQVIFTPYGGLGNATTCSPNGTNVVNAGITESNVNPSTIPVNATVVEVLSFPLTLPTLNRLGTGIVLPNGGPIPSASEQNSSGQYLDLLVVNASDFLIYLAFGDCGNTVAQPPGLPAPSGPTAPVGPGIPGCLQMPPQTNLLLTTNPAIAAVTAHNPQVNTGAAALAAQGANYGSIYSSGGAVGTVTFIRGFASIQYVF